MRTVTQVMPAVVSVIVTKHISDLEADFRAQNPRKKKIDLQIPPEKIDARGMVEVGGGSGFVVRANGVILTNKHVINETNAQYTIITNDSQSLSATILARDPVNDVAILKVTPLRPLPTVTLGNSSDLQLGQTVIAFGNALGIFKNTVSSGIISGLSRAVTAQADSFAPPQEMRGLVQTDAAINPGNSGGPLVDLFGRAIGINAAVVSGAQNIGFAIPISAAERDLSDLDRYGHIKRPLLGLRYLTLNKNLQEKLKLPVAYGAFVTKEHPLDQAVIPESPSGKAGIKESDIVLSWNGVQINEDKSIPDFLQNANVGETITLILLRNGKEMKVKVVLTERK